MDHVAAAAVAVRRAGAPSSPGRAPSPATCCCWRSGHRGAVLTRGPLAPVVAAGGLVDDLLAGATAWGPLPARGEVVRTLRRTSRARLAGTADALVAAGAVERHRRGRARAGAAGWRSLDQDAVARARHRVTGALTGDRRRRDDAALAALACSSGLARYCVRLLDDASRDAVRARVQGSVAVLGDGVCEVVLALRQVLGRDGVPAARGAPRCCCRARTAPGTATRAGTTRTSAARRPDQEYFWPRRCRGGRRATGTAWSGVGVRVRRRMTWLRAGGVRAAVDRSAAAARRSSPWARALLLLAVHEGRRFLTRGPVSLVVGAGSMVDDLEAERRPGLPGDSPAPRPRTYRPWHDVEGGGPTWSTAPGRGSALVTVVAVGTKVCRTARPASGTLPARSRVGLRV